MQGSCIVRISIHPDDRAADAPVAPAYVRVPRGVALASALHAKLRDYADIDRDSSKNIWLQHEDGSYINWELPCGVVFDLVEAESSAKPPEKLRSPRPLSVVLRVCSEPPPVLNDGIKPGNRFLH